MTTTLEQNFTIRDVLESNTTTVASELLANNGIKLNKLVSMLKAQIKDGRLDNKGLNNIIDIINKFASTPIAEQTSDVLGVLDAVQAASLFTDHDRTGRLSERLDITIQNSVGEASVLLSRLPIALESRQDKALQLMQNASSLSVCIRDALRGLNCTEAQEKALAAFMSNANTTAHANFNATDYVANVTRNLEAEANSTAHANFDAEGYVANVTRRLKSNANTTAHANFNATDYVANVTRNLEAEANSTAHANFNAADYVANVTKGLEAEANNTAHANFDAEGYVASVTRSLEANETLMETACQNALPIMTSSSFKKIFNMIVSPDICNKAQSQYIVGKITAALDFHRPNPNIAPNAVPYTLLLLMQSIDHNILCTHARATPMPNGGYKFATGDTYVQLELNAGNAKHLSTNKYLHSHCSNTTAGNLECSLELLDNRPSSEDEIFISRDMMRFSSRCVKIIESFCDNGYCISQNDIDQSESTCLGAVNTTLPDVLLNI